MNQQWTSFIVIILTNVLPLIGVRVGDDQLTTFVQVCLSIAIALFGIFAGWRKGKHTLGGRDIGR